MKFERMGMKSGLLLLVLGCFFLVSTTAQGDDDVFGGDDEFPTFGVAEGGTEKPTRPPIKRGPCDNRHHDDDSCDNWAYKKHCPYNAWMRVHCASSCNTCSEGRTGSCVNDYNDDDCEVWAHAGHCTQPQASPFMKFKCAKACDSCDHRQEMIEKMKDPTEAPTPPPDSKPGKEKNDDVGGLD